MTLAQFALLVGTLGAFVYMATAVKRALDDPSISNLAEALLAIARLA